MSAIQSALWYRFVDAEYEERADMLRPYLSSTTDADASTEEIEATLRELLTITASFLAVTEQSLAADVAEMRDKGFIL
jgi:hypothetical protein